MALWPTSLKSTATCASTRGRRVWNAAGQSPRNLGLPGMPDLSCWVGAGPLPDAASFVRTQLQVSRAGHDQLLQRLPELDDLQASWLLLLFCCSPRCNYFLRMLPPSVTAEYAGAHDSAVLSTFADLLGVDGLPDSARRIAQLPLSLGGLGLMSAAQTSLSAYWAFCADCLPVLGQHLPPAAQAFLRNLDAVSSRCCHNTRRAQPGASSVTVCRRRPCRKTGPPPSLADGKGPRHQLLPAASVSSCSPPWIYLARLAPVAAGPLRQPLFDHRAHVPRPVLSFLSRVLLLRRLRLPLPLSQRYCRRRAACGPPRECAGRPGRG